MRAPAMRWAAVGVLILVVVIAGLAFGTNRRASRTAAPFPLSLDPGTALSGPAPDFTLTDQSGARVSLHSFRGRVVILAFNDSQCTTVCPLTTTAMVGAKRLLGAAASHVALLGIDANPQATSIKDVRGYSETHGMTHDWQFLTGSLPQLKAVWNAYHIEVAIERGQIDHTPALFVISPAGRLAKLYLTQMSYASVPQQAQLLAHEAASLLPEHPRVASRLSYVQIPPIGPAAAVSLPRADRGTIRLGPGAGARLFVFFATWDSQVMNLAAQLEALRGYVSMAATARAPALVAVDEGSVEPSATALPRFLHKLARPLAYPVAIDRSGRVADGYGVQDEPWFVLVSSSGRILWYYDISTSGWLSPQSLAQHVRAALTRAKSVSPGAAPSLLAGSPPPLAALHRRASQLLGDQTALATQLRALRGYPVVINAWASWCTPCRSEFELFASASARYGRRVAFIGVATDDSAGDARSFLSQHRVSYPSYQSSTAALRSIAIVAGLPTTIFVNRAGKVVSVHTGQYDAQGTLDADIETYALGG